MNKILLFVICTLLLVSLSSAAKIIQTSNPDYGLTIQVPPIEYIILGQNYESNIHVFNSSDGVLMNNETVSCFIHVFNISGNHINFAPMSFEEPEGDFHYIFDKVNFSSLGYYSFIYQCNTSSYGGFVSGSLKVTKTGVDDTPLDSSAGISATLFMLFIVSFLFILPFAKENFIKNQWANKIIKRGMWSIGIFVLMWNSATLATISDTANLGITKSFFNYIFIFGWAGYVFLVYFVIASLFDTLKMWRIKKEKNRYGDDKDGF